MREIKFRVWDKKFKEFIRGDLFFEQIDLLMVDKVLIILMVILHINGFLMMFILRKKIKINLNQN
jgi:hypothetical protein